MGLRERKKAETRAKLSWAAIRLTAEHGFDNVKVEDIAAAAGVSPRTFNNYFASKAEAIVARQLDRMRRFADDLRERPGDEPLWAAITQAARQGLEPDPASTADPPPGGVRWAEGVRMMMVEPALQAELLRAGVILETEIAAAVAERTGTDHARDLYPNLVAAAVLAATNTAMAHHLRTDPPVPMEDLLMDALARLSAGLSRP